MIKFFYHKISIPIGEHRIWYPTICIISNLVITSHFSSTDIAWIILSNPDQWPFLVSQIYLAPSNCSLPQLFVFKLTLAYSAGQIHVASSAHSIGLLLPLSHLILIHLIWPLYSTLFVGTCLLGLIQLVQFVRRSFQLYFLLAWPDCFFLLRHHFW
jgi:hypothetical protein